MQFDWKITAAAVLTWLQIKAADKNTYLGLVAIAASFGVTISPEIAQNIVTIAGLLAGFILIGWKTKPTTAVIQVTEVAASTEAKGERQILKG